MPECKRDKGYSRYNLAPCAIARAIVFKTMVYMSGTRPKRSPLHTFLRRILGVGVIVLIVWSLYSIPYDILREERVRLFGETRTSGLVLSARSDDSGQADGPCFIIEYKYVDPDGYAHTTEARLPGSAWGMYRPGGTVEVFYATQNPALARVPHELEPPFQTWLRDQLQ